MEIEEIIDILSEVKNEKLILRRNLKQASTMAKGFKYYIMELWKPNSENPIIQVSIVGQYTLENRENIKKSCEYEFMRELLDKD